MLNVTLRDARHARFGLSEGLRYRIRNAPTHLLELPRNTRLYVASRLLKAPMFTTELHAVLNHGGEERVDLGLLGRKIVTTAGVNYLASTFINTAEPETVNFQDSGTGTTAAAIGDTALQTGTGNARVAGTQTNPSANIYRSVSTLPYSAGAAITEWGIFSASTVGTLFDHFVFSAINVINGDSITFTFNLTLTAGG